MFTNRRDHVSTAEEWLGKSRFAIESGMAFDDRSSEGWCQHVRFEDLMRNPIGAVQAIYAQYGEAPTALHIRRMEVWMRERGRHSEGPPCLRSEGFRLDLRRARRRIQRIPRAIRYPSRVSGNASSSADQETATASSRTTSSSATTVSERKGPRRTRRSSAVICSWNLRLLPSTSRIMPG